MPLPPSASNATPPGTCLPECTLVTGPRGAGKTRWIQADIRHRIRQRPDIRTAVVLAEEGRTRLEAFSRQFPGMAVRRLPLPCLCCLPRTRLPDTLRELLGEHRPDRFLIEMPAIAAAGLISEFDQELGWPRQLVICLDARWEAAWRGREVPPFLHALIGSTDVIVPPSSPRPRQVPALSGWSPLE